MQTATKFTFCRIFCAPVFFVLYCAPIWAGERGAAFFPISVYIMLPLLIFAQITDYLDGKYARLLNQVSDFGKAFDPFADVFLNITVFFCLFVSGYMPAVILLLIVYRELSMTFVRFAAVQQGVAIGARPGGKTKTVLYIASAFYALAVECSLRLGLLAPDTGVLHPLKTVALVLFILCLAASYISFADYLFHFRKLFKTSVR